jgi:hypothetical protein
MPAGGLDYGDPLECLPLRGIWNREKFNLKDCWNTHPRGWEALSAPSQQIKTTKILILIVETKTRRQRESEKLLHPLPRISPSSHHHHTNTMKFCMAAFLPAAALAFTTNSSPSQRSSTRLAADAVATATYTFTKSEEIFAEAKTVCRSSTPTKSLRVCRQAC